ncbi:Protein bric-a-brac 2 [Nymphon striatum]|nr:Protein bric-a-brac 2 [Nymphon striatum]
MGTQQFCLRWKNHQSNIVSVINDFFSSELFVDVTLACDGLSIKAHKIVLSACSPFFEELFKNNPCKHPIVILKDMSHSDLKAVVDFMYRGEVDVSQDQLSSLLKTAEVLKIKGLVEGFNKDSVDTEKQSSKNLNSNHHAENLKKRNKSIDTDSENFEICNNVFPKLYKHNPSIITPLNEFSKRKPCSKGKFAAKNSSPESLLLNSESLNSNEQILAVSPDLIKEQSKAFSHKDDYYSIDSSQPSPSMTQNDEFVEDENHYEEDQPKFSSDSVQCHEIHESMEVQDQFEISGDDIEHIDHNVQAGTSNDPFIERVSIANSLPQNLETFQGWPCQVCGKPFTTKYSALRHMQKYHQQLQAFECFICHKRFPGSDNLRQHMRTIHHKRIVMRMKQIVKYVDE